MSTTLPTPFSQTAQAISISAQNGKVKAGEAGVAIDTLCQSPGAVAQEIERHCPAEKLRLMRGSLVFAEGTEAAYLYLLRVGAIRSYKQMPDGRRGIIGFALPGDLLGTNALETYPYSAEAINATTVLRYERAVLDPAIATDVRLTRSLLADAYRELTAVQGHLLLLGRKSAVERVASFLHELLNRKTANGARPTQIDLPMTRNDIGDYLGLTTETVSRVLSQLRDEGVIELPNTSMAVVRDLDRVRSLAAGDGARTSCPKNGHALLRPGAR